MIKVNLETKLSFEITDEDIESFFNIFKMITPERKVGFKNSPFSKEQMKIINNMNKTRINYYGEDS